MVAYKQVYSVFSWWEWGNRKNKIDAEEKGGQLVKQLVEKADEDGVQCSNKGLLRQVRGPLICC